jgi:tetratricopeptide (TPR) repeat protein
MTTRDRGNGWVIPGALACMLLLYPTTGLFCQEEEEGEEDAEPGEEEVETEEAGETGEEEEAVDVEEYHANAIAAFKEGDYETALENFLKANEAEPNPVTIFNIARCYDKLGRYAEAYGFYKEYLDTGEDVKAEDAGEAMSRIEAMPSKLTVTTQPADAAVSIDGGEPEAGGAPVVKQMSPGFHTVTVSLDGYETVEREIEIPVASAASVDVTLTPVSEPERKKTGVPITLGLALGATVSTSEVVASYLDAGINLTYRIKRFSVGLGIDNKFFSDSYMLTAYPMGAFTLELRKSLALSFSAGFGAVYFFSSELVEDSDGDVVIKDGHMWDLAAHVDARLLYKLGPVHLQIIPVSVDILVGAGSIKASPLAQFLFLVGVSYDFD